MLRRSAPDAAAGIIESAPRSADLRALHNACRNRYPFLLESTAGNRQLGRYDILFRASEDRIVADRRGGKTGGGAGFLDTLDSAWRDESTAPGTSGLPFEGGWFVYLGYELAGEIEPALDLPCDPDLPTAFAVRCRSALVRDALTGECWIVAEAAAAAEVEELRRDIGRVGRSRSDGPAAAVLPVATEEAPAEHYIDAVLAARRYIAAGDVYQANLSREWNTVLNARPKPALIHAALASANPAPFAGSVTWEDTAIISSSPERLLRLRDGVASTRPIAGTRPRSADSRTDMALSGDLFADPKERAEHIMLIDLERNDLGRICEPGSVTVDEMMTLESYAHVHHIVSNVNGRIRSGVTPGQAIAAVFPGGTITGCPKFRCMQIIAQLEDGPRGAYTGSFGYLNRDGSLDLNILIRTIVLRGDRLRFRAGAGIVADSKPASELSETRAKAAGMLKAIGG